MTLRQPIYSDHGLNGYQMWGNVLEDGTFAPNTQSTINPLAALYERNDVSSASRFIGNAQFDYRIHGFEDLRLNLNLRSGLLPFRRNRDCSLRCRAVLPQPAAGQAEAWTILTTRRSRT